MSAACTSTKQVKPNQVVTFHVEKHCKTRPVELSAHDLTSHYHANAERRLTLSGVSELP